MQTQDTMPNDEAYKTLPKLAKGYTYGSRFTPDKGHGYGIPHVMVMQGGRCCGTLWQLNPPTWTLSTGIARFDRRAILNPSK